MKPSDILLTGKVALVTGSGAGIGQGIAVGLAAFGSDVVVADIDLDRAAVTASLVEAEGRKALAVRVDAAEPAEIDDVVRSTCERFGRIDILVNNAGGVRKTAFLSQSERSWRRHIDLNLTSALAATAAVAPRMAEGGRGGVILNIASSEAFRAAPGYAVYAACKAAMVSFTRSMALELAELGIRVLCLAPDLIATPGTRGIVTGPVPSPLPPFTREIEQAVARYIPLGREGAVEEVAAAAVFCASDMASYLTGITLPVDGGTWASSGWTRSKDGEDWHVYPDPE